MKRLPLLALAVLALGAAVVPQRTPRDYYYSIPNVTNLLGQVMGEPPAYRTPRREDVAWLREAACERAALAAGAWWTTNGAGRALKPVFGRWPLAASNRFESFVAAAEWIGGRRATNIVVGWNWVTNTFGVRPPHAGQEAGRDRAKPGAGGVDVFGGLALGDYLSPTNLPDGATRRQSGQLPAHTNVVTSVVTNWGGWSVEGGEIVWHVSNHVERVEMEMTNGTVSVHTNAWRESLPWCVTNATTNVTFGSALDLLFPSRQVTRLGGPVPAPMRPFPSYAWVTNGYNCLRDRRWLVDETSNTNVLRSYVRLWRYDADEDEWKMRPDIVTNDTSAVGIFVYMGTHTDMDGYEAGSGRMILPSRFDWDVVNTGGVCRIARADLYAHVDVRAEWFEGDSYKDTNGTYVAKLGTATMMGRPPPGGNVCFEAHVDGPSVAKAAAAALGAPALSPGPAWGQATAGYDVQFFLVYELEPWASLDGWND